LTIAYYAYTLSGTYEQTERLVRLLLDLGTESDIDALDAHLAERGLSVEMYLPQQRGSFLAGEEIGCTRTVEVSASAPSLS